MRPRLLWYLEATIDALDHAGALPATRGILLRWLDALRARWPESGRLAFYPAFAT